MDCTAIDPVPDGPIAPLGALEDWSALITELTDVHGMSQREIAAHCHCGQTTISDLLGRGTKDPRHRIGEALRALRASKRREAPQEAVAQARPVVGAAGDAAVAAGG